MQVVGKLLVAMSQNWSEALTGAGILGSTILENSQNYAGETSAAGIGSKGEMMTGQPEHPEWLTAAEAAAYLRVKTRSLLLWTRQGKLQAYMLSGTRRRIWRFRKSDLDAALLAKPMLNSESPAVLTERKVS